MNKEFYYKKIDEIFEDEKTNIIFKKQVNLYLELKQHCVDKNKYNVGDYVKLTKGMFMRGEGALADLSEDKLKFIKEYGFISPDIIYDYNKKQKTPLCIPVWNIQNDILLKEYINLYSGSTFVYTKKEDGYKKHTSLVPYKCLDEKIESFRNEDIWMWYVEQTKENRFMPSLSKDDPKVQLAFIMNMDKAEDLVKNDIFNLDFDKEILKKFIPEFFIKDFIYAERNDLTTNRESAIIFGIPSNLIEGILVGRIIENDEQKIRMIKNIFNDCYICNLDGEVIVD